MSDGSKIEWTQVTWNPTKGQKWDAWPEPLRIREFPQAAEAVTP